mmetsp:Transcript_3840/g.9703  ORF Transcript_3840/g.9703 Transcript_3840/m.9703 type:complete len:525 (-) Transcript_3840:106-1680(-)
MAADNGGNDAKKRPYEYDLAVIGGGSGGMAAAKEAARLGAKVVLFDYVKPSPKGTKWGLGGTCVNVGCVPKKLMHQSALIGVSLHDAVSYGWKMPAEGVELDWEKLRSNVQGHVKLLNFSYKGGLASAGVNYINGLAKFEDDHTISFVRRFKEKNPAETLTADKILIAVGGRPYVPKDVPGTEHCITSDDIFALKKSPGKTLCVGAGYIALECAGFLNEIGFETVIAVRSMLLRGFDRDAADKIHEVMEAAGNKFLMGATPKAIKKLDDGQLEVTFAMKDGDDRVDTFDTVLYAAGRYADTTGLNLDAAGLKVDASGKFKSPDGTETTNVPHIFAVGDVLADRPELTPVAIDAGEKLVRRLFAGSTKTVNYDLVATTIFTPSEYGVCGLSEAEAAERHGADAVETFLWQWTSLEVQAAHRLKHKSVRVDPIDYVPANCMCKLVCLKAEKNRVIGFHYVGPSAGEVTQGVAIAMRCGATKEDFDETIGIHPTDAEAYTTMEVTRADVKEPGDWTAAAGCGGGKCG